MDEFYKDEQAEKPKEPLPEGVGNPEINFFAKTNFRGANRKFGIKIDDRRRHMYVVGKTGMGKTTLLENMVLNDIYAGHGIGLVDPHGDFAEKILNYIPANRINDVVYFNPGDINHPIGFNILETINPEHRHLVASGLMGVFKKIWPDVWSARMEYILNNTILALLDYPGTTLLGINRLLAEKEYRDKVVAALKDPVVKSFWQTEFAGYSEKFRTEAVAPIQNKIGQFLSASVIRNIVAQVKSRINIREIMDTKKIFIMNLSKGRIGEDNSRLLGGMLITKIQLAAMERVDIPEDRRNDFFLYVDEFQNFATESFANILSEARKYRLDLIMAHQYMEQLDEKVLAAVIGNVGTSVTFRVGSSDAEILAKEFIPTFVEEDLVNLPKFQIYLKLMIDGVASRPFSAETLGPVALATGSVEKVIRVSRERYAVPREKIEDKIMRWSGMAPEGVGEDDDEDMMSGGSSPQANVPKKQSGPSPVVNLKSTTFGTPPKPPMIPPHKSGGQSGQGGQSNQGGGARRPEQRGGGNKPGGQGGNRPQKPPQGTPEKVVLGDPGQKGISLAALAPKPQAHTPKPPEQKQESKPEHKPEHKPELKPPQPPQTPQPEQKKPEPPKHLEVPKQSPEPQPTTPEQKPKEPESPTQKTTFPQPEPAKQTPPEPQKPPEQAKDEGPKRLDPDIVLRFDDGE